MTNQLKMIKLVIMRLNTKSELNTVRLVLRCIIFIHIYDLYENGNIISNEHSMEQMLHLTRGGILTQ